MVRIDAQITGVLTTFAKTPIVNIPTDPLNCILAPSGRVVNHGLIM